MKKNDYKFHKDAKNRVESDAREKTPHFWSTSNPIFIPKRKKFKR